MNKDNEPALVICDPDTAQMLMEKDPNVKDALVIVNCMEPGMAILVNRQEFFDWMVESEIEVEDE